MAADRITYKTLRWYLAPILLLILISAFKTAGVLRTNNASEPVPAEEFVNFESAHVHPLDMTPDGTKLLAVNTAANTLEVFAITAEAPVHQASIPVGFDPVSVRVRNNQEAWVANVISDNVSIIDLDQEVVVRTLQTENEPSDIVFAGNPLKAFVSCAERESILVFDLDDLDEDPNEILLIGEQPRAMAVSPDGNTVYTAFFESGNQTTVISGNDFIANGGLEAPPAGATIVSNDIRNPNGPYGGNVPVPNNGTGFQPAMNPNLPPKEDTQSLVVKKDAQGRWMDDNGGDWTNIVSGGVGERVAGWDMKDRDVAVLNANTLSLSYQNSLGNILMAMAVNPTSGKVSVVGTDALNHIRFVPNIRGIFMRVNLSQFSPGNANNTITDLNGHLDYSSHTVPASERQKSLGDPRGIAWTDDGSFAYVTGMGSNNVVILDQNGNRVMGQPIEVGEGPTGILINQGGDQVYVLNKFEGSISTISYSEDRELYRTAFFDPTPTAIKTGRKHLYNTHLGSGNGTISCASCHVDGKWDRLAWDLGDPSGEMESVEGIDFHPLKGLKTTQSLIDIIGKGEGLLHWRGDRTSLAEFAGAFEGLQGLDAPLDSVSMQEFEDLLLTTFYPPNPYRETTINRPRNLNGLIRGPGTSFQSFLMADLQGTDAIGTWHEACGGCHVNHTGRGVSGSSFGPVNYGGNENMSADLRPFYKKLGFYYNSTESTAGFGFMSDGVVDTEFFKGGQSRDGYFFDFHAILLGFAGGGPTYSNLGFTAFPHEAQDSHFAIGEQALLSDDTGTADSIAALLSLVNSPVTMTGMQQADTLGLIVKGMFQGEKRGFYYLGNNIYQSDSSGQTVSHADLINDAQNAGPLVWTIVHKQVAKRLGVDRNSNGILDKDEVPNQTIGLRLKMYLEGPYNENTGLMNDALRTQVLLGNTDPYGLNTSIAPGLMQIDDENAPVDWLRIQLRDINDPSQLIAEIAGLVQKDGDIMMADGSEVLEFAGIVSGSYYVFVRHYNHLAIASSISLDPGNAQLIDLSDPNTPIFDPNGLAVKLVNGVRLMWAGDANGDEVINVVDKNSHWRQDNGQAYQYGIRKSDWNLDGAINAVDINGYWRPNNSKIAQLP